MGIALTELLQPKPLTIDELHDKIVAIDAFNFMFQFLASLRTPDGALLTDSKGNITSHLVGMFSRTTHLMQKGVKCVFVFDGQAPALKQKERDRRKSLKEVAQREYELAKEREDTESMKKYAQRTTSITEDMVEEAKKLLTALGLPYVQAPSEGEAQAAYMAQKGDVDFVASQDADVFLFQAPKVIRNLSILGKRKKTSKLNYETIGPELITLSDLHNQLGIDNQKLIALSMLIGTDFNPGGIKGIGPKTALKIVKDAQTLDEVFIQAQWAEKSPDLSWKDVFDVFTKMPVTDDYSLDFRPINEDALKQLLCDEHDFAVARITTTVKKLQKQQSQLTQKGLGDFV
ncbi:MAG: flap endonuclease-1 [Candidatus Woesearchaeota archaeon]